MKTSDKTRKTKSSDIAKSLKPLLLSDQENEHVFRLLTEQTNDVIFLINREATIIYANPAAEKAIGKKIQDILGSQVYQYLHPEDRQILIEKLNTFFKGIIADVQKIELRILNKDETWNTVEATAMNLLDNHRTKTVLFHFHDITERKKTEALLRHSEEKYRLLAEHMKDVVWITDLNLNVTYVSPSATNILGWTVEEIKQLPLDKLFTPKSFTKAIDFYSVELPVALAAPTDYVLEKKLELEFVGKNGQTVWGECMFSLMRDKQGNPVSILGEARDITERKLAEERYSLLADNMANQVWIMDLNLNLIYISPSVEKLYGYTMDEIQNIKMKNLFTEESYKRIKESFIKELDYAMKNEPPPPGMRHVMELEAYHKDGHKIWIENRLYFIRDEKGKPVSLMGETRDITERKLTQQRLKESEEQYRLLADHMKDQVWMMDMNMNITYISPSVERALGYSFEEIKTLPIDKLLTPESFKKASDFITNSMPKAFKFVSRDSQYKTLVLEFVTKAGETLWGECSFNFIRDENNNPVSILGEARNVTERKIAEEKLRQSEEKYRTILEDIHEGYFETDLAGNFTFFNDTVCRAMGYTREELMGMNNRQYTDRKELAKVFQAFNKVYVTGEPYRDLDWQITRKDGAKIHIEGFISLRKDASGKAIGFRGVVRDITDRKIAEEQLQETLGRLKNAVATTIQVLMSAVEARDPYTAGHQSRAANLACAIAAEMGLNTDTIEGIRLAGIIHDIGKLSIPAEILSKPSRLTEIEYSLIKVHPQSGYEMLKDVSSPWPLAKIVHQHHERMDGSGYPLHLKADDILIEARILAVADVVEAMASHRPYRAALGVDAAVQEIEKNKGILYDETVVEACVKLFIQKGYKLV